MTFDLFGTVYDWRGTIYAEMNAAIPDAGIDWGVFADNWARAYSDSVRAMTHWTNLDVLLATSFYRLIDPSILRANNVSLETSLRIATTWSRLKPWPDVSSAFKKLEDFWLFGFSNANLAMADSLASHSGLPWSGSLSAEYVKRYKPHPSIYRMAIDELEADPYEILMVAAHCFDLNAARKQGMRTALIRRKGEIGSDPDGLDHEADFIADDMEDLASQIMCS
jgi:2-haloacid dehalogenase